MSLHNLSLQKAYHRPFKIPANLRFCEDCNVQVVGDEFHYVMQCDKFEIRRKQFFDKLLHLNNTFETMNSNQKFVYIMSLEEEDLIQEFAEFLK